MIGLTNLKLDAHQKHGKARSKLFQVNILTFAA